MTYPTPGDFARDWLDEARKLGIADPVFLLLSSVSEHARAVYEEVHGRPLPPHESETGHEFGPRMILREADAGTLLRKHGGRGGSQVADLFGDPFFRERVRPDFWFVGLLKEKIHARAFRAGEEVWHTETGYNWVRRDCQTPTQLATDLGPSLVKLNREGGGTLPVCGPTGKDAIMARALVVIATDRVIDAEYQGLPIQIPVDDGKLASLLLDVYGDMPRAVAEAIQALRKLSGQEDTWLTEVLWGRSELADLARKVKHELTGE